MQIGDWTEYQLDLLGGNFDLHERLQDGVFELLVGLVANHDHHANVKVFEYLPISRGAGVLPRLQVFSINHADVRHVEVDRVVALLAGAHFVLATSTLVIRDQHVSCIYDPSLFQLISPLSHPRSRARSMACLGALSVRVDRK